MSPLRRISATILTITAFALANGILSTGAPVVSVTLSPSTITGGTGGISVGTVTISAPAPTGGQAIALTTSNTDLAASTQSIVIPAGATSATFVVGTNSLYRRYSGLAFNATITATNPADGTSAAATLTVTAQAIPGPFTGGTVSTQGNAAAGRMCGGSFGTGQASERGILYRCDFPQAGQFSVCRFLQECTFGCQTQAAPNLNRNDVCRTTAPFPVAVTPELLEGGRRSNGRVFISAPATSLTSGIVNDSPGGEIAPGGVFPIPEGTTSAAFDVETFEMAVPAFLQVRADLFNPQQRYAHDFLAVVPAPGTRPPSGPLAVFSVDTTPMAVVQGNPSIGTLVLNGVAPSGGAVVTLSSNSPAASVPATVKVDAGRNAAAFGVTTERVSAVTITASFGGLSRTTAMTVSPFVFASATPSLATFTVNPATVVGGARSKGRVTVNGAAPDPSDGAVRIALASDNEAAVVVARHVTVGHGGTFADFRIRTFAVAQTTVVTLTATFNGVTRSAMLTVDPSGPPPPLALSSLALNPSAVVGGNPSTGTAFLNSPAPAGGVSIALSTNNTVGVAPASVTVPAGQTSANFQVTTSQVAASTTATITGTFNGVSRSATLTVTPQSEPPPPPPPPPPSQTATLTVTATGRSGERVMSTPAGINVSVGSTGSASFNTGTSIRLSVTDGRDAIWSGACSTGGNKQRTCTFTINSNASVTANVQ